MMRIYASMARKEHELIGEGTRAAPTMAKPCGARLGGDRAYRPSPWALMAAQLMSPAIGPRSGRAGGGVTPVVIAVKLVPISRMRSAAKYRSVSVFGWSRRQKHRRPIVDRRPAPRRRLPRTA